MYDNPATKIQGYESINAQTSDNNFLPPQFVDDLLLDYGSVDNPMYKQEVLNEYVNMTAGAVYYGFNRDKHVKPVTLATAAHVYAGVDFNIDFLNGVYVQYVNGRIKVGKELHLEEMDANTFRLAEELGKDLIRFGSRSIVPDSTGKARKTSSVKSDHQILRDSGFRLEETTNPLIRDRQNAVNRLFNLDLIDIDPSCVNLISELETLSARDEEGKVSHIAVALGYVIWKLCPLKRVSTPSRSIAW